MSLTAAAGGFVVFLLCARVIQSQNDWGVTYTSTEICALKGSTVEIRCSYRYPSSINDFDTTVQETLWLTEVNGDVPVDLRTDSQYSGRVEHSCENNICTLRIRDVRESDSAEYKFMFITNQPGGRFTGSPGVTLSVTDPDLQVKVERSSHPSYANLMCVSSCQLPDHPSYIWYKNGQKVPAETSYSYSDYFNSADSYSCAVKGQEAFPSPPVYAPKLPSVSVSPSGEIVEGSSVTLTCSSDANPAAKYTWYKRDSIFKHLREDQHLVFSSIQSSDSGEYYCTAENELGKTTSEQTFIDVKYPPRLPSVSVRPSGKIMEGSSVTLTCSSDAKPAATYTWYKENQKVFQDQRGIYRLTSIRSEHRGIYSCKSENRHGQKTSSSVLLDVQYPPRLPSVSVRPSSKIMEGSSVTLTCSSDAKPAATYTWYKENQEVFQDQRGIYGLTSIRSEHRGNYYCKSENRHGQKTSSSVILDVEYGPKLPSVSVSPSGEIVEGSSVNLTCSSDANPAATYTWYRENEDSPKASGQIFTISDVRAEHSGNYYCEVWNKLGRHNSTLHLNVVSGKMKSVAAGSITAIWLGITVPLLVIIILSAFFLIRRKKSSKRTAERSDGRTQLNMGLMRENPSAAVQRRQAEEQDDLCYARVIFSKNQEDPLYSNISPAQLNRHKKKKGEEEETAEYSAVNVKGAGASPQIRRPEDVKDPSALYSTVNKTARA